MPALTLPCFKPLVKPVPCLIAQAIPPPTPANGFDEIARQLPLGFMGSRRHTLRIFALVARLA